MIAIHVGTCKHHGPVELIHGRCSICYRQSPTVSRIEPPTCQCETCRAVREDQP